MRSYRVVFFIIGAVAVIGILVDTNKEMQVAKVFFAFLGLGVAFFPKSKRKA